MKRFFDFTVSLLVILALLPVFLIIGIIIAIDAGNPVIYKQYRVGKDNKLFYIYKFRTMKNNTRLAATKDLTEADSVITKSGRFLRKTSLDELPQLFNVLKGDMSLVGPRPELPYFVQNFQETVPLYMVKHLVKPGITGLAQVKGYRGDTSIPRRIEWDVHYIENWNLFMDIKILFMTVFKSLRNEEALIDHKNKKEN